MFSSWVSPSTRKLYAIVSGWRSLLILRRSTSVAIEWALFELLFISFLCSGSQIRKGSRGSVSSGLFEGGEEARPRLKSVNGPFHLLSQTEGPHIRPHFLNVCETFSLWANFVDICP